LDKLDLDKLDLDKLDLDIINADKSQSGKLRSDILQLGKLQTGKFQLGKLRSVYLRSVKFRSDNLEQGCQIFLDTVYQKGGKDSNLPLNYQMAKKSTKAVIYFKWPNNIPTFPFQGPPKFTQNGSFV
jgi:hypothetical protein